MKVLVVNSTNNIISGAEFAITDMLKDITENIVFEMMTPGNGELSDYYKEKGFKVYTMKFSSPRRKYPGLYLISSLFVALWLRKKKFDLILCNTFAASFFVSLGAKWARKKVVIYTREYFSKKKKINYKQIKRAHSIIAVSEDVKLYYGQLHHRVFVCHDTIDIGMIASRISKHTNSVLEKSIFNVGYIGRITTYKQPDLFIKAIPFVIKQIPNAHFHIVGKSIPAESSFEQSLKLLAKELKVEKYVTFWGYRSDSIEILCELDCFCMTSDREPFPRTILEAMLTRTPVICSNTGGCLEMVKNNRTGLYFEVQEGNNALLLANQIIRLYYDKMLQEEIRDNAFKFVQDAFGEKNQVSHFCQTLLLINSQTNCQ